MAVSSLAVQAAIEQGQFSEGSSRRKRAKGAPMLQQRVVPG